jgi:hypothetical protein
VFYNVWAHMETENENRKTSEGVNEGVQSKEESLRERVQLAVAETIVKMNDEIPRPALGGVTSADARKGITGKEMDFLFCFRECKIRSTLHCRNLFWPLP